MSDQSCDNEATVTDDAARDLLFGLFALQDGLVNQAALVAAFNDWSRDRGRPLADHLVTRRDLDAKQRATLEALVTVHLMKYGDDAEKSLAAAQLK